jgi:hypothetical protein
MSKFASFMAGFGKGYVEAKDKEAQRERRDKQDKMQEDLHRLTMEKAARESKQRQDTADANAPRSLATGTVTTGAGQTTFSADPQQAARDKQMAADIAEMQGMAAPTQTQGSAITGDMATGHQITTGPVDMNQVNSQQARNERTMAALRANGNWKDALSMQTQVQQQALADVNLKNAKVEQARNEYNAHVTDVLAKNGGNVFNAIGQMLSESQVGALNGNTYAAVPSKDGKTIDIVATTPDGTTRVAKSFNNNQSGELAAFQTIYHAKPETMVSWHADRLKQAQDIALRTRQLDQGDTKLVIDAAQVDNQSRHNTTMAGIAQQTANTAADNAQVTKMNAIHTRGIQDKEETRKQETHDAAKAIKTLPKAAQEKLDLLKARISSIQSQIAKAQAEGMSNDGGVAVLNTQLDALTKEHAKLVNVYLMPKNFKAPALQ